ncbi:hypothetical protein BDR07DRAFT_1364871 [Suillus spraguei]|nr:hypothetical protein BDR07DRAFT_1364871 [Suillus spraguei]
MSHQRNAAGATLRCKDGSKPLPDKPTLLADCLKAVLPICNNGNDAKDITAMVWSHKFEDTSTANIRRALGLKDAERGRRVLYIVVFRKLDPITDLSDKEFLAAWWHIVVCHYALWEKNVYHRDISPSNLMVYKTSDGRYIGVLNDFDLSSTRDSSSGQERTGTVPFMAIELLTKEVIKGEVQHLYRHDAESFLWVLTWVCLRYREGQLLRECRPLDGWLKVDAIGCRMKKNDFLITGRHKAQPSSSHLFNWKTARLCFSSLALYHTEDPDTRTVDGEVAFRMWFEQHIHKAGLPLSLLNVCVEKK